MKRTISAKLERLIPHLACPLDGGSLEYRDAALCCLKCSSTYSVRHSRIYFSEPMVASDRLDSLKEKAKRRFRGIYHTVLRPLFAPAFPFPYKRYVLRNVDPGQKIVVDIGSGNVSLHPKIYSLDGFDYENTDIVCDLRKLPFRKDSVDVFTSSSVLEHVSGIEDVLNQLSIATKPGGEAVHIIPFMYPFHASPDDFQRFTHEGARRMLGDWLVVRQIAAAGPFTLFNAVAADILSSVVSFGSGRAKAVFYLALSAILAPIKFLDLPFIGSTWLLSSCPVILTHLKKPPVTE